MCGLPIRVESSVAGESMLTNNRIQYPATITCKKMTRSVREVEAEVILSNCNSKCALADDETTALDMVRV